MNLFCYIKKVLARKTDPGTSHDAAASMVNVSGEHCRCIVECLKNHGPLGKDGIAQRTGLTGVSVARRLAELERQGFIRCTGNKVRSKSGRYEREWESA